MHDFKRVVIDNTLDTTIDGFYEELLNNRYSFMLLYFEDKKYVLTKERSLIAINDEEKFLKKFENDIYYKTIVKEGSTFVYPKDLNLFYSYLEKYKEQLEKKKYGNKYYFGCVAVATTDGFITTIRGKEKLDDYTLVKEVNHENHTIEVVNKKASLNAPLLDYLFKNEKVKVIVHLHDFYDNFNYEEYAFPGTVRDSKRCNTTSFNIKNHGVIYLFDKDGNLL